MGLQAQIDTLLLERDTLKERIQQLKVTAFARHANFSKPTLFVGPVEEEEERWAPTPAS